MKGFRTLSGPCQRCGQYHDSPAQPAKAATRETAALQPVAASSNDMTRAPEPPDMAAMFRKLRGGVR
jgi:hypothetical protein